jgi:hypothetical protein
MCHNPAIDLQHLPGSPDGGAHIPEEVTERRRIETQDGHETVLVHEIENFRRGLGRGNSRNDAGY